MTSCLGFAVRSSSKTLSFLRRFSEPAVGVPLPTIHDVGRSGLLNIRFSPRCGRTVLDRLYHEAPFKVTRLHYSPGSSLARVIVMHSTAGLFGGDRLEAQFHVEKGARALVTSQSATKVHPSGSEPACQLVRISVESGGELHYYVDPLIPFANSRLRQEIRIEVGSGARFYYWESMMAGRVERGESWRFLELCSETSLFIDTELAYLDRFDLRPTEDSPSRKWRMDQHGYMGTAIVYDPAIDGEELEAIRSDMVLSDADLAYGLDVPFEKLMIGRFLAGNGISFRKVRDLYQATIFRRLAGELNCPL